MGSELLLSNCGLPIKVLMVEDNPDDVALNLLFLKKAHWDVYVEVVGTPEEFLRQLRTHYFDVILSDYALGNWTGLDAFEMMQHEGRDIPFILVTGALGDEKAVECIRRGMTDYILKGHLERLSVAISRAVEEKALSREHKIAETALRENEAKFRKLADALPAAVFIERELSAVT
jgi:DNA-binding NtrC family response regulator